MEGQVTEHEAVPEGWGPWGEETGARFQGTKKVQGFGGWFPECALLLPASGCPGPPWSPSTPSRVCSRLGSLGRGSDQSGGLLTLPCLLLPRLDRLAVSWGRETSNKQDKAGRTANGTKGALWGHGLPPCVRSVGDRSPQCAPGGAGPVAAARALPAQPPSPEPCPPRPPAPAPESGSAMLSVPCSPPICDQTGKTEF